jgi:hypothetical protein
MIQPRQCGDKHLAGLWFKPVKEIFDGTVTEYTGRLAALG